MKTITLSQGKLALVDNADFERVSEYKWSAAKCDKPEPNNWYAVRTAYSPRKATVYLHRFVTAAPADVEVDHIDGDGLNCCQFNLRVCDHSYNTANKKRQSNNTSGYKGVVQRRPNRWDAQITVRRKFIALGRYTTREEAARAYDRKAREAFGAFAVLNFPDGT